MAKADKATEDWYADRLREYHSGRYRAHVAYGKGESEQEPGELFPRDIELSPSAVPVLPDDSEKLPAGVREAYAFYRDRFENADIGSARVYRVPVGRKTTYAVRVRTDGDDGWLEVYDAKGGLLAAGRTYIEQVAWGTRDWLRAQVEQPGDLPPELQDAPDRTLWGKPLPD